MSKSKFEIWSDKINLKNYIEDEIYDNISTSGAIQSIGRYIVSDHTSSNSDEYEIDIIDKLSFASNLIYEFFRSNSINEISINPASYTNGELYMFICHNMIGSFDIDCYTEAMGELSSHELAIN